MQIDDPNYAEKLWADYYARLKKAIASRVRSIRSPVADESEIALSAINSFINQTKNGRIEQSLKQDEIWRLLLTIAINKTSDTRKKLKAKKRGGDRVIVGQSEIENGDSQKSRGIDDVADNQHELSLNVDFDEFVNYMLGRLPDEAHRDVILLKLQGASVKIIAECLQTTTRTVQRMLVKIGAQWQNELLEPQ